MKTIKKLWNKVKKTATTTKEKFTQFIKNRIAAYKSKSWGPKSKLGRIAAHVVVLGTMVAVVTLTAVFVGQTALLASLVAVPYVGQLIAALLLFYVYYVIGMIVQKIVGVVVYPQYYSNIKVWDSITQLHNDLWTGLVILGGFVVGLVAFTGGLAVGVLDRVFMLIEVFASVPRELYRTKNLDGFKTNMKAWGYSWTPTYWYEFNLQSITEKKLRIELERKREEAKAHPSPAQMPKNRPTPKQPKGRNKQHSMRVVKTETG